MRARWIDLQPGGPCEPLRSADHLQQPGPGGAAKGAGCTGSVDQGHDRPLLLPPPGCQVSCQAARRTSGCGCLWQSPILTETGFHAQTQHTGSSQHTRGWQQPSCRGISRAAGGGPPAAAAARTLTCISLGGVMAAPECRAAFRHPVPLKAPGHPRQPPHRDLCSAGGGRPAPHGARCLCIAH